jgi:hypothetical protein
MPYNAATILVVDPAAGVATTTAMGSNLSGTSKWVGACLGDDGRIVGAPYGASQALLINVDARTTKRTNFGVSWPASTNFRGACSTPAGECFFVPVTANAAFVRSSTETGAAAPFVLAPGVTGFAGGSTAQDGFVYLTGYSINSVRIDPFNKTMETILNSSTAGWGNPINASESLLIIAGGYGGAIYSKNFVMTINTKHQRSERNKASASNIFNRGM